MKSVIFAALLVSAAPVVAAPSTPGNSTTATTKDQVGDLLRAYEENFSAGRYAEALAALEKLDLDPGKKDAVALVSAMKAPALLGLKRDKEALALIADVERLAPQDPEAVRILFYGALATNRPAIVGDILDKMIARFPDQVREIEPRTMAYILRGQREAKDPTRDDRLIALAQLGFGGTQGDYLTAEAVKLLLKRGSSREAVDLLRYIDEPRLVENFLTQKKYAALWPALEDAAGPNMTKLRQASVLAAEQDRAGAPDDIEKLKDLANTLRHALLLGETVALSKHLPATAADWKSASEDMGWLANEIALAFHAMGKSEDADRTFATLNEATIDDSRWLVSMKINRLELLVADGKFDQAQKLMALTEESAANDGSPYAQQLVRRLKYCTLSGLGRKAEAAELLPEVLNHAKDARGPTVDGLLCAGEMDKAEDVVLEALKDEEFEEDFVRALQKRPLTADDPSIWQKGWVALRGRPAIAAAFDRLGRDLPQALLPPAAATN